MNWHLRALAPQLIAHLARSLRSKPLKWRGAKRLGSLTDGNLARHLQALAGADLIEIEKLSERGRPLTRVTLSRHGRERFIAYIEELGRVLRDLRAEAVWPGLAPGAT